MTKEDLEKAVNWLIIERVIAPQWVEDLAIQHGIDVTNLLVQRDIPNH